MGLFFRNRQVAGNICLVLFLAFMFTLLPGQLWADTAFAGQKAVNVDSTTLANVDDTNITDSVAVSFTSVSESEFNNTIQALVTHLGSNVKNLVYSVTYNKVYQNTYAMVNSVYLWYYKDLKTGQVVNDAIYSWIYDRQEPNQSVSVIGTVWQPPETPTWPNGAEITLVSKSTSSISLSWTAVNGATGYKLYYNNSWVPVSGTAYSAIGLNAGTTYQFKVEAVNAVGDTTNGPSINVTTESGGGGGGGGGGVIAPLVVDTKAPTWTNAKGTSSNATANSVTLSWSGATDDVGVAGYKVQVYKGTTLVNTLMSSTQTYTVSGLSPNTSYTFKVFAYDAAGNNSVNGISVVAKTAVLVIPPKIPNIPDVILPILDVPVIPGTPGSAITVGKVTVVTPNIQTQGGQLVVSLPVKEILAQLNSNTNVTSVMIKAFTAGVQKDTILELSSEILSALNSAGVSATIKVQNAIITLPKSVLNNKEITDALANKQSVKFYFKVSNVSAFKVAKMLEAKNTKGLNSIGSAYDYQVYAKINGRKVDLSQYSGGTTISLNYKLTQLAGQNPRLLGVYYLNPKTNAWEYVGGKVNASVKMVSVNLKHLSSYALMIYNNNYTDMQKHWAKDSVNILAAKRIINSVPYTQFGPHKAISRAEFTVWLARALNLKTSQKAVFKDVKADAYYAKYVSAANAAGITLGDASGKFKPNDIISRQQILAMLVRAGNLNADTNQTLSDLQVENVIANFQDKNEIDNWFKPLVALFVKNKLVVGRDSKTLAPKEQITRAEAATLIVRMLAQKGEI